MLLNSSEDFGAEIATNLTGLISNLTRTVIENNGNAGDNITDLFSTTYGPIDACDHTPLFNCTVEEYLAYARGPQTLPLSTTLPITIFFLGIFISGILGNVLVCVVIIRNVQLHTATNYYLFSLAVSDLIILMFGLPYELSLYWHQYPFNLGLSFCKLRAFISEASTYVSVLTIVAFSMERFLAICHPLHLYTMSGFKRAARIIALLWIVSFLSAVPFGYYTKINYLNYPLDNTTILDSAFCAMLENPDGISLLGLSSCIFFAVPMLIILVLYGRMGLRIRSRTKHTVALGVQQGSMHGESRQTQSRKAIIRMLATVVIAFFICWAPFHAQRLLYSYGREWEYFQTVNNWLFSVAGWLYYVTCTINPILYNVMSHRYRVAFRDTLCGKTKRYYQSNGFCRDQSSFRETTVTGVGGYESSHLIRVRSVIPSHKLSARYNSSKERGDRLTTTSGSGGSVSGGGGGGGGSAGNGNSIKWKDEEAIKNNDNAKTNENSIEEHHKISSTTTATTTTTSLITTSTPSMMVMTTTTIITTPPTPPLITTTSQPVATTDVVVVIGSTLNGRPKCFTTTNGNHLNNNDDDNENSLSEKDETCI